jgi:DNA-binding NarL/FixJ family response regulator
MGNIRILLVDDHAVVREGYKTLLQEHADMEIIAEAGDGEAACLLYRQENPDLVIMDISLPGISGIEAVRRIVSRDENARIVIFSFHEDMIFVEQALQVGALGYITKNSEPDILIKAVRTISEGGIFLDPQIAQKLAYQKSRGVTSGLESLSPREFEITRLMAEGLGIHEIAEQLSLNYKTVANYNTQIKRKLNAGSVADITRLAIRHGLIEA